MYASETTTNTTVETQNGPIAVTLQKLNWRIQKQARRVAHETAVAAASRASAKIGGEALAMALAQRAEEVRRRAADDAARKQADGQDVVSDPDPAPLTAAELKHVAEARYRQYDQDTVLLGGIQSTSDTVKKTVAAFVADLDEADADRLHREILDLTLPPIDPLEREADRQRFF